MVDIILIFLNLGLAIIEDHIVVHLVDGFVHILVNGFIHVLVQVLES